MMHSSHLRSHLEQMLDSEVRDELWDLLVEMSLVEDVIVGASDINDLAKRARQVLAAGGSRPTGRRAPRMVKSGAPEPSGRDLGALSSRALSILLAGEASNEPEVQSFREEVLERRLLAHKGVEPWVKEKAEIDGRLSLLLKVPVEEDPEGVIEASHTSVKLSPFEAISPSVHRFRLATRGQVVRGPLEWHLIEYSRPGDPWPLAEDAGVGGVLDRLWHLSRDLAERYPWEPAQATMFVLTGLYPEIRRIEANFEERNPNAGSRIKLEVDPSVTPSELVAHYQALRKAISPRRHRSLGEKHLRLAAFVAERPEHESWERRMRAWNNAYPESIYPRYHYGHRSNFARDASQARHRLLHPDYKGPTPENAAPALISHQGRKED